MSEMMKSLRGDYIYRLEERTNDVMSLRAFPENSRRQCRRDVLRQRHAECSIYIRVKRRRSQMVEWQMRPCDERQATIMR